jgi:hypothetical protein
MDVSSFPFLNFVDMRLPLDATSNRLAADAKCADAASALTDRLGGALHWTYFLNSRMKQSLPEPAHRRRSSRR